MPHSRAFFTMDDEEFVEKFTSRRRAGRYEPITSPEIGTEPSSVVEQETEHKIPKLIEVNRIRLLTDGVIAVAITLLIVELKVPSELTRDALLHTLYEILGICAVTMILTGVWVTHLHVFTVIQGSDSIITFFNMLLILFICIIPFTVMVAVHWTTQFYAMLLVNVDLILITVNLAAIWIYATYNRKFVFRKDKLSSRDVTLTTMRICTPIIFYTISIAVAAASRYASIAVTICVALMFALSSFGLDVFTFGAWLIRKIRGGTNHTTEVEEDFLKSHEYDEMIIERLKGFADALFAIVVTILILQMHAPVKSHVLEHFKQHGDDDWELNTILGKALVSEELYPVYIAFAVSVILVSSYWKAHCYILSRIHRTDQMFLFANMIQFIAVSFIPYTATLLGKYPTEVVSAATFNGLLTLVGIINLWVFWVANFKNRLAYSPTAYKILANMRLAFAPIIYLIAFGIAFANTWASIGVSLLVPVMEILAALGLDIYRFTWRGMIWIYEKRHNTRVDFTGESEKNLYRYSIT